MEFIITFLEGISSFISPCILPMLPMYVSYFAGQERSLKKSIINSIGFVLGFTIIFVLLGVLASSLGRFVLKSSSYINLVFGVIVIIFGLHYTGILKIKFLEKTKGIEKKKDKLNLISAILFGMAFAVTWTPCVGIFLGSALMLSATSETIIKGGTLLLVYSIGLGIPFIITTIFLEKLKKLLEKLKKHYNIVNIIAGLILIISGFSIALKGVPKEINKTITESEEKTSMGIIEIHSEEEFEKEVEKYEGTVFVDFYATWCQPCQMMSPVIEKLTQEHPDVKFVKVDVDQNNELAIKYDVMSIPMMLVVKNGEITKTFIGVTDKTSISKEF